MPVSGGMDKENMIHLHNELLLRIFFKKIMNFTGKWIELEKKSSRVR